jgi:hypothetical protein
MAGIRKPPRPLLDLALCLDPLSEGLVAGSYECRRSDLACGYGLTSAAFQAATKHIFGPKHIFGHSGSIRLLLTTGVSFFAPFAPWR